MHHALILANDPGTHLAPLTNEATPTAFLALGDRRTLLQQTVEGLLESFAPSALWVVVERRLQEQAEKALPAGVHVIGISGHVFSASDLARVLEEIRTRDPEPGSVLIQPATQSVADRSSYLRTIAEGLDRATSESTCMVFLTNTGEQKAISTGIEAWPFERLRVRVAGCADGSIPWREAARDEATRQAIRLGAVGWQDLSTWDGVRQRLAYVKKPWGFERLWALTPLYAGKILFIREGETLSLQYHREKDETIRILSGRMRFRYGPAVDALETAVLDPGMSFPIPTGLIHQMEAVEDCTVVEVSTPQLADVVRLEDKYGRA